MRSEHLNFDEKHAKFYDVLYDRMYEYHKKMYDPQYGGASAERKEYFRGLWHTYEQLINEFRNEFETSRSHFYIRILEKE